MRKFRYTVLIILFLVLTLNGYSQTRKDYKNGKYNYKVDYPTEWELKEMPSLEDPSSVKIFSSTQAGVIINVKVNKSNRGRSAHDLNLGDLVNQVKKNYSNAEMIDNDYGNFLEKPAIIIKFTYTTPRNDAAYLTQYSFINGDAYYCIQAYATIENYSIDESLFNSIVFSFAFTAEVSSSYAMNSKFGFSITFPYGWKTQIKEMPYIASNDEAIMAVDANKDGQYQTFTANEVSNEIFEDIIRQQYKGTEILYSQKIRINNEPCIYIRFKYTDNSGSNITKSMYYIIKNSTLFIVECTAKTSLFGKYETTFDNAANTIRIN